MFEDMVDGEMGICVGDEGEKSILEKSMDAICL
jgi:hypothetical protein